MNELPNELMCLIFNKLNLIDLFNNCRLVSKRWKVLIDSIKFQHLIISDFNISFYFYLPSKPINPNHIKFINDEDLDLDPDSYPLLDLYLDKLLYLDLNLILNSNIIKNNFIKLKYLKIDFKSSLKLNLDLNNLNKFNDLEHLELVSACCKENSILKLPNLKFIYLNIYHYYYHSKLQIDTPKLVTVFISLSLSKIEFVHPESIEFLDEYCYVKNLNQIEDLNKFKNLKKYQVKIENLDFNINQDPLSKLPIDLQFFNFHYDIYWYNDKYSLNHLNNFINFILNDKINKKRKNLKIYFDNIELIENKSFDEYGFQLGNNRDFLEVYHKNYDQLTTLPNFRLTYNRCIKVFKNEIPIDFFNKFNRINSLSVKDEVNENQLIVFLNGCSNLTSLSFYDCYLDKQFYNQLPKIENLLVSLTILRNKNEIDFKFVNQFKLLAHLTLDLKISIQFQIEYLVKNSKIQYKNNNILEIKIRR